MFSIVFKKMENFRLNVFINIVFIKKKMCISTKRIIGSEPRIHDRWRDCFHKFPFHDENRLNSIMTVSLLRSGRGGGYS